MPEASGSDLADESDYSIFENKTGLAEDMKFLASMPELCDVTFLVGDTREPICAVKAVLAARSRVFQKMFYQAPSPQRKKEPPPKENKLRVFLKRSSEPLLNLQNATQQRSGFAQQLAPIQEPNQHPTVIIEEFEPDVFRQLIEYIHTGCVTLQPRTLLGLMNAADYYGLDQLRKACSGFVQCCITVDTVCALLASAERYIQYKCTKSLVQKVLEFVDEHGNEVLNLGSFTLLPQHVVRLILAREELRADEFTKFQAALMWSKKYCDSNQNQSLKDVIGNFLEYIQFHKIPANVLMKEVHPLGLVPSGIIVNALAYQADPTSVDPGKLSPHRVKHHDRSLSVQSSLQDPCGSNTSLSSTGSDEGSDEKQHSGKYGIAEQESRDEQQWQKQREEAEEDLQRLIEQRSQFQQMRQEEEVQRQQEELQVRRQEEELRKQEMQEEFDMRQKKKKEEEKQQQMRQQRQEETLKKQQQDEESRRQQEEELKKQQEEQEKLRKQEEGEMKRQQEETRRKQDEESRRRGEELNGQTFEEVAEIHEEEVRKVAELDLSQQQSALRSQQQHEQIAEAEQENEDSKKRKHEKLSTEEEEKDEQQEVQKHNVDEGEKQLTCTSQEMEERPQEYQVEEAASLKGIEERVELRFEEQMHLREADRLRERQMEEAQRRIREERKMQLQLEELKTRWTMQQELIAQKQEEMVQREIEERRYAERMDGLQFQQLQLHFEGRKPVPEARPEQMQIAERRKSRKRKRDTVEVRVKETELHKHGQQSASADGVTGFYIKLVVKREDQANLVWLFKTHKF